jgi:hypothetical protein
MRKITILVACKDNLPDVNETLNSIESIWSSEFIEEIIILDDSVDNKIYSYCAGNLNKKIKFKYFKCNAKNLFEAWNKGIDRAIGNYIWFLNSGDLSTATIGMLEEFLNNDKQYDYVFFDYFTKDVGDELSKIYNKSWLYIDKTNMLNSILPCHQAMFFSKDVLNKWSLRFDEKYKISADSELIFEYISKCENYFYIAKPICTFLLGGISNRYRTISHAIAHYNDLIRSRKVQNITKKAFLFTGLIMKYFIQLYSKK